MSSPGHELFIPGTVGSYYTSPCSGLTLWHRYRTVSCPLSFSLTQKVSEFWRSSPSALKDPLCWLRRREDTKSSVWNCWSHLSDFAVAKAPLLQGESNHYQPSSSLWCSGFDVRTCKVNDAAFTVRMNLAGIRATFPRESKWIVFVLSCSGGISLTCAICCHVFIDNIRYAGLAI